MSIPAPSLIWLSWFDWIQTGARLYVLERDVVLQSEEIGLESMDADELGEHLDDASSEEDRYDQFNMEKQ